ncbi:MAG: putative Histidine kinase [Promethearchaeota archaeon]|nr:MAG: putative Histidine kinase [Candidatus Lokiarchaeota archaeon]
MSSKKDNKFLNKIKRKTTELKNEKRSFYKIRGKLIVSIMTVTIIVLGLILPISYFTLYNEVYRQKHDGLEDHVRVAYSVLESSYKDYESGILDETRAKQEAIDTIKKMRYGEEGQDYFWIQEEIDGKPFMVMHPYRPDLNHTDLTNFTDPDGFHLFVEFQEICNEKGEGFVSYKWQYYDDESKIVKKISFVKLFEKWNWIIGSGMYVQDVERAISHLLINYLFIAVIVIALAVIIAIGISQRFSRPIRRLKEMVESAALGDLEETEDFLSFKKSSDEIGDLTLSFEIMLTNLRKLINDLKHSEEKYRQLFENSPEGIILTDQDGKILDCNPAFEEIFGYEKHELIGVPYYKLGIFNSKQVSIIKERFIDSLSGKEKKLEEFKVKKRDGRQVWILYQSALIRLENEPCILAITQDISQIKKAEKLIEKELTKLKELEHIKNELVTRTSHELKTPLTSILGSTDLLLNMYQDLYNEDVRNLIEIIKSSANRLKNLVNKFIDISLIESEKLSLTKENLDIGKLIVNCAEDLNYLAKKRDLSLDVDINDKYWIKIDKNKMIRVLKNLILNAIQNTPSEGNITIRVNKENSVLEILIKDTGVGFTESEKQKIFQKFGKIERYGKGLDVDIEGPGLGLFLSKQIIEMHGGTISVKSRGRNMGSTFKIRLSIT